jgi:hypothetical protein
MRDASRPHGSSSCDHSHCLKSGLPAVHLAICSAAAWLRATGVFHSDAVEQRHLVQPVRSSISGLFFRRLAPFALKRQC